MRSCDPALRLQGVLTSAFANEVEQLDEPLRKPLLESLDLLTSFECWDRMRTRQQLSDPELRGILIGLLTRVIGVGQHGARPRQE